MRLTDGSMEVKARVEQPDEDEMYFTKWLLTYPVTEHLKHWQVFLTQIKQEGDAEMVKLGTEEKASPEDPTKLE